MDEVLRPDDRVRIVGTVKNLIFQNQENGYTVLRLDVGGDQPRGAVQGELRAAQSARG